MVLGRFSLIFWLLAEIVTYGLVIQQFGVSLAFLIGVVSLAIGLVALKRLGLQLAELGARNLRDRSVVIVSAKSLGWAAFGAILLILPGFISNAIGLVMLLAHPRAWIAPRPRSEAPDGVIDLDDRDWREAPSNPEDFRRVGPPAPNDFRN